MRTAVVTLTRDRTDHLVNLARGLAEGSRLPDRLVVSVMGGEDPRPALPDLPFPVVWVHLDVGPDDPLPLARARNRAAAEADADELVFLDVDCIPGPTVVDRYASGLEQLDGLLMGGVRYLPPGATAGDRDWERLVTSSQAHPSRPEPGRDALERTDRYELFWSLTFAVRGVTFQRVGGFDETFSGYGAEDTDLAFTARQHGVPLAWIGGARSLHQHHETFDPPLDRVSDIVTNARRFHGKRGRWPMEDWLGRFDELGLVRWRPDQDELTFVREPDEDELRAARRLTAVPSS